MTLRYEQSGGFMGLRRGCELEVAALPPELRALVAEVVVKMGVSPSGSAGAADLREHVLVFETGGEWRNLRFDDLNLPGELVPLVGYLAAQSGPLPMG